jgi:hypothetical protein
MREVISAEIGEDGVRVGGGCWEIQLEYGIQSDAG